MRGKSILETLNHIASTSTNSFLITSIFADVFVFTYPFLIIYLFIYGYRQNSKSQQRASISIVVSATIAIATNLIIQSFVRKSRPDTLEGLQLIIKHIPTISFPSDHAAISMAVGIGTLLVIQLIVSSPSSILKGPKKLTNFMQSKSVWNNIGYFLVIASIIMGVCRVAVAVHWPTDILVGWIIGIVGARVGWKFTQSKYGIIFSDWIIGLGNKILDLLIPSSHKS